ncbi:MAG: hypothetical protein IJ304_01445 [Clostridia bacterium]|nr:hypothetical protein [Clostridia bacterium]
MDFANELAAKVMGEILAKGMSLSDVDLKETVDTEAVKALGKIKNTLAEDKNQALKLAKVQEIINEYKM